jgi:SSS family solute:Na+ symporter
MVIAPLLDHPSIKDRVIFDCQQKINGLDFIPVFAIVLIGMLTKIAASIAAQIGLVVRFAAIGIGYFVPPSDKIVASLHKFRFLVIVFYSLLILMLAVRV